MAIHKLHHQYIQIYGQFNLNIPFSFTGNHTIFDTFSIFTKKKKLD